MIISKNKLWYAFVFSFISIQCIDVKLVHAAEMSEVERIKLLVKKQREEAAKRAGLAPAPKMGAPAKRDPRIEVDERAAKLEADQKYFAEEAAASPVMAPTSSLIPGGEIEQYIRDSVALMKPMVTSLANVGGVALHAAQHVLGSISGQEALGKTIAIQDKYGAAANAATSVFATPQGCEAAFAILLTLQPETFNHLKTHGHFTAPIRTIGSSEPTGYFNVSYNIPPGTPDNLTAFRPIFGTLLAGCTLQGNVIVDYRRDGLAAVCHLQCPQNIGINARSTGSGSTNRFKIVYRPDKNNFSVPFVVTAYPVERAG